MRPDSCQVISVRKIEKSEKKRPKPGQFAKLLAKCFCLSKTVQVSGKHGQNLASRPNYWPTFKFGQVSPTSLAKTCPVFHKSAKVCQTCLPPERPGFWPSVLSRSVLHLQNWPKHVFSKRIPYRKNAFPLSFSLFKTVGNIFSGRLSLNTKIDKCQGNLAKTWPVGRASGQTLRFQRIGLSLIRGLGFKALRQLSQNVASWPSFWQRFVFYWHLAEFREAWPMLASWPSCWPS